MKFATTSRLSPCSPARTASSIYRRLIPQAFDALAPGGFIALEIGYGQQTAIQSLLASAGFTDIEFTADLQGISRVAVAQRT